jgi:hypothetical protein
MPLMKLTNPLSGFAATALKTTRRPTMISATNHSSHTIMAARVTGLVPRYIRGWAPAAAAASGPVGAVVAGVVARAPSRATGRPLRLASDGATAGSVGAVFRPAGHAGLRSPSVRVVRAGASEAR